MDTSTDNNDTTHFDNGGNIDPAAQINIAQNRDDRPAPVVVMGTAELVNHIIRYLPASSYRSCSQINRDWRSAILFTSLNYMTFNTGAQQSFESTPRRIFILSAYILQYSEAVDTGLPVGGVSANQFVFSCQTRADSVDSYGSSGSNSDHKSGESIGHTGTSGRSSGMSHLQRHHNHQPGHDVEPYHSFHTYQSSAIVPNVYYKTGIQLPSHLSSPPPLPPPPILAQQQRPGNVSATDATLTTDQMLAFRTPLLPSPREFWTDTELSSSGLHRHEADFSNDLHRSSMMMAVDPTDNSHSHTQILLPPHGLSTLQQQQQQSMLRVVPCPYELPIEGSIQYGQSIAMLRKRSRTSSRSAHSADSNSTGGSNGNEPSSTSVMQGGSYIPHASPIKEESSSPSGSAMAYGSPYAAGVASSSSSAMMSPVGGGGQGSSSGQMSRSSGKELASEYQRALLGQNQQQLQQWQREQQQDIMMDTTSGGEMRGYTDLGRRSSGTSSASFPAHYNQHQHHHPHHPRNDRHHHYPHHDQAGNPIESFNQASTSSSIGGTSSHHHHHRQQHQQERQHVRQQQPGGTSRNWSMTIQTYYYQTRAFNAMIVACREHMLSSEGQGGAIVEKTETSRIIWNETTRQEHIWTITSTLMDRTNPGAFVEADYDPHSEMDSA
ncbi:hypothetical protein BGZ96_008836 [Linnemannia gamsii]|uniref:F-box domain-containing protein n=1 Tax=Linnemannia gamsii TaxID=64522 RepID=A0ABQ7KDT6_9FUNG|nr:hypothetical protein BGZ96_008836 [Linnemannia gamsii]